MKFLFTFLSIFYITAIFLFARSPIVSDLAPFNPYSLLHIPLYGILTVLLIFSFDPIKLNRINPMTQLPNDSMTKFHNNPMTQLPNDFRLSLSFFLPGLISLIVAIFDEIYQSYIPTRDASIIDVFLDTIGIVLAIYLVTRLYKIKK